MENLIKKQMRKATKPFYDAWHVEIFEMLRLGYQNNILHNPRLVMYKLLGQTRNGITIAKDRKVAGKLIKGSSDKIGATIAAMKYKGLVPNKWTIDTTRSVTHYSRFLGVEDGINSLIESYYLDRWANQTFNILLMSEASGYLGVIKHIADKFRVPYVPAKGDMSIQLKIDIANMVDDNTVILYFGDYDLHGLRIPQTIENDMRVINPTRFKFVRMFLNAEDIETYNLPVDDKGQVQMEQLPEQIAIDSATMYIDSLIDRNAWLTTLKEEKQHRQIIASAKDQIKQKDNK